MKKKAVYPMLGMLLLASAGCSTTHQPEGAPAGSETMMVIYHVKPGKEAAFEALLGHAWEVYSNEHLVYESPHTVVRAVESGDKPRFVEIFTWIKAPDKPPESVKEVWNQEQTLCEARNGHNGIEGGEVHLVTGR